MTIAAHDLRAYQVVGMAQLDTLKPVVLRALDAISQRSGDRNPPETVFRRLMEQITDTDRHAVFVVIDQERLNQHRGYNGSAVGLMTLKLLEDEVGTPIAFISRGWIEPGYNGAPFDVCLPLAERWAIARGARRIFSQTERSSAALAKGELMGRLTTKGRLLALLAYAKWIGRRGFVMRETMFEKRI